MLWEKMLLNDRGTWVSGLFNVCGDFGIINDAYTYPAVREGNTFTVKTDRVLLRAEFEVQKNGAVLRKDSVTNISDSPIRVDQLCSRFALEGCDYDVYTQFNGWEHENSGAWQPLNTQISVSAQSLRTCHGGTPLLALCQAQNRKTTVFHLIPNCQWKMTATRWSQNGKMDQVIVETGFENGELAMEIAPGETVALPQVLFYLTDDRMGLGAERLHEYYLSVSPRKRLPVMYNTWMCFYDYLDYDRLCAQVDAAAELGFEIFTIDAGWFGNGKSWGDCIGDWVENQTGAFCGRMAEFSEYVRKKGLTFGLWLEPERALPTSELAEEHPEFMMHGTFLNFARADVREYLFDLFCSLIDRYGIGAMKFDFNDSFTGDPERSAFYRYFEGQRELILRLRERYPELYLSGCASGGYRIELGQANLFDSFWISDNQGPYEGMEIYKEATKRVPPCLIEKWNVQTFLHGVPWYGHPEPKSLPISCNDGVWTNVTTVSNAYTFGFLSGGPVGFSCDLTAFPQDYHDELKQFISDYKKDRDLYISARSYLLADTGNFICLQYSDPDGKCSKIHLFTKLIFQQDQTVYPVVCPDASYRVGQTVRTGEDILENGVTFSDLMDNDCRFLDVERV